jgi:anti-sigma regulatory factor (Ser/Thr protein kinase)
MCDRLELQITNSLASVRPANEAAARWLADRGVPAETQFFANLAIEEFATNSIKYGFDDAEEHLIEVSLSLSSTELVLTLVDGGQAFNPLEAPEPKLDVPVDDRPIGGLGIYLVRKMADRMEYVREGNRNKLEIALRRPTAH